MESVKKWLNERSTKKNGVYVHYSPPKVVGVVSAAQLRSWARGPESRLERAVLAGQGRRLLAEAGALPITHHLPALVAKCDALHAAVEKGSLLELQEILEADYNRRKYVMCRDEAGVGLLHKAVYYDFMDIAEYLVRNYPQLVHVKDSEGRTPLHYAAVCRDEAGAAALLEAAGGARGARDAAGRTPAAYRGAARTLLALPSPPDDMATRNPPGLVIKRHNIRIWCHDCDMSRLQRVVWEGHGARLLSEVSNQPVVRKFLEAVPYIMNTIRDIHTAVVENDLEGVMKHSGDPVPPQALSSRDGNNMTVMHKAAGLGHSSILKYLAERYPQGVNDIDNEGRTPLHYAAAVRDDQHTYNTLVNLGADESVVDNKNKTPAYYVNRPQEIDKSLLKTLPDAPRTPSSAYPSTWDWKLLDNYVISDGNKKTRKKNFKASTENISSKNNTNTMSDSTENITNAMKASSTHEFISDLPELDEGTKPDNVARNDKENEGEKPENKEDSEEVDEDKNTEQNETENVEKIAETGEADEEQKKTSEITKDEQYVENNNDSQHEKEDDKNADTVEENTGREELSADAAEESANTAEENENEGIRQNTAENNTNEKIENQNEQSTKQDKDTNQMANNEDKENSDGKQNDTKEDTSENEIKENGHIEEFDTTETVKHPEDSQNDIEQSHISSLDHITENERDKADDKVETNGDRNETDTTTTTNEGNNSSVNKEDDDDVQVPAGASSEYSEYNALSTAEASTIGSAKIGNVSNGRKTRESLIEGLVNGEAEQDSQDASITQRDESVHGELFVVDNEIDPEVTDLINTANMEMLATLVLNGEGSRLIGRRSGNSELQAFLENVPSYMQKINQVHMAAKEGNLKNLQSALDRRKFAIARDPISPNGATPLHVATVFGKTNIIKYLGSRFPETLSAVDFEGRTALHYAAVLPDNGHYYNLMQQLGANTKDLDDNGSSAEDYFKNPSQLPFDQLLSDFGMNEEAIKNMFSDKGSNHRGNGPMDIPIFQTEEGRYLAKSLGDPLIKGLTEVANVKPKDPVAFLASFLQNFPEHEKPRIGTPQVPHSNLVVAHEEPEVENERAPELLAEPARLARSAARTATRPHRPIDVVTVDPQPVTSPDAPETANSSAKRDEHGQSMLHFAAARTHAKNALFQLLQESDVSIGYRDELYRTARDVSAQANVPDNTAEIDRFVLYLAARGNKEKIMELVMEGYDHILDVVDEEGVSISDVITQRGDADMINVLASIPPFEEARDALHGAVRRGGLPAVQAALDAEGGSTLVRSQNSFGRTALHIAVLAQREEVVAFLAQNYPELLRIGDNLERTPLHYAMGVQEIESLSRILIRSGAKRVLKDLKGRQPSYYFMNKSDILRLQEEEEIY